MRYVRSGSKKHTFLVLQASFAFFWLVFCFSFLSSTNNPKNSPIRRSLRLMNRRENVKKELEKAMKFRSLANLSDGYGPVKKG